MSVFRFHHVYYTLLATAALCAFVIPQHITERLEPNIQLLFSPVARPVRGIAGWATGRWAPQPAKDVRPDVEIRRENQQLALENVKLRHDLDVLARRDGEWETLASIRTLYTRVPVVGTDPGPRETLAVQASSLTGLGGQKASNDRTFFVLYPQGVVGTLHVGLAGGQVRLVTDPSFRVEGYFYGLRRAAPATRPAGEGASHRMRLNEHPVLIEGAGRGTMVCRLMTMEAAKKAALTPGDWVVLQDRVWPEKLHGQRIGTVTRIAPRRDSPLFAEITIKPADNLLRLQTVMVLREEMRAEVGSGG